MPSASSSSLRARSVSPAVASMSVIGSAATTIQRHVAGTRERADALAEVVGVGEEERRVEAVQHESRDAAGVGIALGVVVALEVVDPAEHRVVRAPGPADEVQQRERDRDPDAPEHAEHGDAGERHHRQRELRASPVAQAPRGRDVDEAEHRDDHDRRERRLRQVVHEAGAERSAAAPGRRRRRARRAGCGRRCPRRRRCASCSWRSGSPGRTRSRCSRRRGPRAPGSGRPPGAAGPRSCATGRSCRRTRRRRSRPPRGSAS